MLQPPASTHSNLLERVTDDPECAQCCLVQPLSAPPNLLCSGISPFPKASRGENENTKTCHFEELKVSLLVCSKHNTYIDDIVGFMV